MELNLDQLISFTEEHKGERIFMFGFTFMVYHHFYKALANSGTRIDLSNAVMIHGGGWKKLTCESVSSGEFRKRLHDVCGISSVYDYYGMAEQTGSIFMECEQNHFQHRFIPMSSSERQPTSLLPVWVKRGLSRCSPYYLRAIPDTHC